MKQLIKNKLALSVLLATGLSAGSQAAPLSLDSSFSGDGMLTANYSVGGTYHTYFRDVEITPNDKILAVGYTGNTISTYSLLLVKYNLDGSLDTSFGTGGKVDLVVDSNTRGEALVIQPDGKFIVVGHSRASASDPWSVFVKRFNVDGSIDPNFTEYNYDPTAIISGTVTPREVLARDIALTANGKILVGMREHFLDAGNPSARTYRTRLAQLNSDGSVDASFGTSGLTDKSHFNSSYNPGKFALSPTGDIYVPSRREQVPVALRTQTMRLSKYDINGSIVYFGGAADGWERRSPASLSSARSKAIDQLNSSLVLPDGNVISVGCIADVDGGNHHTAFIQAQNASGGIKVSTISPIGKQHSDSSLNYNNAHPAVTNEHCFNDVTYHPSVGIIAVGGIRNGSGTGVTAPTWNSLATSAYTFTPGVTGGAASILNATAHTRRGTVNQGRFDAVAVTHGGKIVSVGYMLNSAAHEAVVHVAQGAPLPAMSASDSIGTLSFTDEPDADLSTTQSVFADNNIATTSTTGFTAQVYGGTAEVNGSAVSNPLSLVDGDSITLEHDSAATAGTKTTTSIVVNNGTGFHRNNQTWAVGDTFAEFNSTTAQPDTTPDAFTFAAISDAPLNSFQVSAPVTISGINAPTSISLSSAGSHYSINGGVYTDLAGVVNDGDTITIRHTSANTFLSTVTTTFEIGGVSATFSSTTEAQDTTPDAFSFVAKTDVEPSAIQVSADVAITGINSPTTIAINGGSYRINNGAYRSTGSTVNPGDTVTVRHTSSNLFSTARTNTLTIGGVSAAFTSTTRAADTTPDAFVLQPNGVVTVSRGFSVRSRVVTLTGFDEAPISINTGEYSINGAAYTSAPGTIRKNNTVRVRHSSASSFATGVTSTLTIGSVQASFESMTEAEDTTPNAFDFGAALSEQAMNTVLISAPVFITGINSDATVTVTNGSYSINGGAYTTAPGTVRVGQNVRVKHTTSGLFSDTKTTTLTVGGISSNFVTTTIAQDTTPNGFSFGISIGNKALNSQIDTGEITVAGINSAATISITNGEYQINNEAFTSDAGTVNNGDTVKLRHTTAGGFSTLSTTTVNIGGITRNYTTRTIDRDVTPDAFSFSGQNNLELQTQITSDTITVAGINDASAIEVTGGEYQVNGGAFVNVAGTVNAGDTVTVRHTTADVNSTDTTTTLTIGGMSADFVSITKAAATDGSSDGSTDGSSDGSTDGSTDGSSDGSSDASSGGSSGGALSFGWLFILAGLVMTRLSGRKKLK